MCYQQMESVWLYTRLPTQPSIATWFWIHYAASHLAELIH